MKSERSLSVDAIKFVVAFRVISAHLAPSTPAAQELSKLLANFAVPFFLLIALYFFTRRMLKLPRITVADLRADRLWVPYLVWSLVYLALRLGKGWVQGEAVELDWVQLAFFGTAAVHLYFLPLLLVLEALTLGLIFLVRFPAKWPVSVLLGAVWAAMSVLGAKEQLLGFYQTGIKSWFYIGLAFTLVYTQQKAWGRKLNQVYAALTLLALALLLIFHHEPLWLGVLRGPVFAYGVCALALNWNLKIKRPFIKVLLSCSYGVYLAHFGFLEALEFAAAKLGWQIAPYSILDKVFFGVLIGAASVGLVLLARRHWLTAYLFFGEKKISAKTTKEGIPSMVPKAKGVG